MGAEGEKEGGTAAAAGEEDKEGEMAAAAGEEGTEEESQKVVRGRGEDGWGIYRVWHAECCIQLSLAQFVSFRIQQLRTELATLRREWEEGKAAAARKTE